MKAENILKEIGNLVKYGEATVKLIYENSKLKIIILNMGGIERKFKVDD